ASTATDTSTLSLHDALPISGTLVFAALLGLVSVGIAWRLLPLGDNRGRPGGAAGPTGRIAYMRLTKPLTDKNSSDLSVVDVASRSEEHTSELQSLAYLVCRL